MIDRRRVLVYNVAWIKRARWRRLTRPPGTRLVEVVVQLWLAHDPFQW